MHPRYHSVALTHWYKMAYDVTRPHYVYPSGAETGTFWDNEVNATTNDALAMQVALHRKVISKHGTDYVG